MLEDYLKAIGDRYEVLIRYIFRLNLWHIEARDGLLKTVRYLPFSEINAIESENREAIYVGILTEMVKELDEYKERMGKMGLI